MSAKSLSLSLLLLSAPSHVLAANKPHIIMHLVDDWGWANAGWHSVGNPEVYTPNMDQLVQDGIELDRACKSV